MERDRRARGWQLNLGLTAGVMATVMVALVLAQLDALQERAPAQRTGLPIVNIQATAIAIGQIIPLVVEVEPVETESAASGMPTATPLAQVPDDLNPRPDFITGVSQEGAIYTVCGEVPEGWLLYTVQPGQTLNSLAGAVEATAADLANANCLGNVELTAGMQILVPREPAETQCGPPQWWVRYQIRFGDTLGGLAASRGTTIDEVLRANCRDTEVIQAGQLIFLPPGRSPSNAPSVPQPSLTPLPTDTPPVATVAPTATSAPPSAPTSAPVFPTATQPPPPPTSPPTATPPPLPTAVPPPTNTAPPPPTQQPTEPPPTAVPPTEPPPTEPPPTATAPIPPTEPPPPETPEPPPNTPEPVPTVPAPP